VRLAFQVGPLKVIQVGSLQCPPAIVYKILRGQDISQSQARTVFNLPTHLPPNTISRYGARMESGRYPLTATTSDDDSSPAFDDTVDHHV